MNLPLFRLFEGNMIFINVVIVITGRHNFALSIFSDLFWCTYVAIVVERKVHYRKKASVKANVSLPLTVRLV